MNDYPLINDDNLQAASGRPLNEVTLDNIDSLSPDDLRISAESLRAQAQIAREAGYTRLAENLTRAAELTAVPNDELLKMYELLRPERASYEQLQALAVRLEQVYSAEVTARFVREAAEVYKVRGLLRR